jgi:hypothetical protein
MVTAMAVAGPNPQREVRAATLLERSARSRRPRQLVMTLGAVLLALWLGGCAASPERCGAHAHASSSTPSGSAQCSFSF